MMRVRTICIFIVISTLMVVMMPAIAAVTITRGNSYSEEDTVLPYYEGYARFYGIEAGDDDIIEYSVKVKGNGTVQVYLAKGDVNYFFNDMEYFRFYSTDTNTKKCSESMSVSTSDGHEFTLVVITESEYPVTYDVKIKVVEDSISTNTSIMICVTIIVILVVLAVIGFWISHKKKTQKIMETKPPGQYSDSYHNLYSEPGAPPQYPAQGQSPPPPPSSPPPYYPPQQPRQPY